MSTLVNKDSHLAFEQVLRVYYLDNFSLQFTHTDPLQQIVMMVLILIQVFVLKNQACSFLSLTHT